ncbi:hypothetical protein LDL08_45275 [Nonomuraea glycinis]|uniref:Transposase n=1 Tax=Nonomuraea glycinis TaxID=2047744 RepID=A0A918AF56_9ACTN|nr:hypothetical protein [Nonomuraea glycinis]MCA2183392.1 hypothetical protein [Nonomuraea glycinis]GGP18293.1 hypothetical protein GCM10012278_89960 [Nonomuraea glycinis]
MRADHPDQTIIGDENFNGREFEQGVTVRQLNLLRPVRKGEPERTGARLFKTLHRTVESMNQTFKSQLDLVHHGGRTQADVIIRVPALTTAIWHDKKTGQPIKRSLTAYDH